MIICIISSIILVLIISILIYGIRHRASIYSYNFEDSYRKYGIPIMTFTINNKEYNFLIDSGSTISFIHSSVVKEHNILVTNAEISCLTAGGDIKGDKISIINISNYCSVFKGIPFYINSIVDANLDKETDTIKVPISGILGGDFLSSFGFILNYDKKIISYTL